MSHPFPAQVAVAKCSGLYWLCLGLLYPLVLLTALWAAKHVPRRRRKAAPPALEGAHDGDAVATAAAATAELDAPLLAAAPPRGPDAAARPDAPPEDVDWSRYAFTAPCIALVVGILSALLGLGGGELLGPVLLAMGMMPRRSSATTATTSLLSTLANFAHYAAVGELAKSNFLDYALWVIAVGLAGGLAGRLAALRIATSGRASLIAAALGAVLVISTALMVYDTATTQTDLEFHSFCTS